MTDTSPNHLASQADIPFRPWVLLNEGRRGRRAVVFWLMTVLLATPTGMLTRLLEWTGLPVQMGGTTVYLTIYLPLLACVPIVIWFGYLWAAIPAYVSTFLVALLGGMPLQWILVFSLANPLGLALYTILYRANGLRRDLRGPLSAIGYVFISLIASLVGSAGSFVWAHTSNVSHNAVYSVWQGWWVGGWLQSVILVGPLLFFFGPSVERVLEPLKPDVPKTTSLRIRILPGIVSCVGVLSLYVYVARVFSVRQFELATARLADEALASEIRNAFAGITYPLLVLVAVMIASGVFAYRAAAYWSQRLIDANEKLEERNRELHRLANSDSLTGLSNRRRVLDVLGYELQRSSRTDAPLSVLMVDVDRFKAVNDVHGHLAGDEVLRGVGRALVGMLRDSDSLGRYGGEEFLAVLPDTDLSGAVEVAERLRSRVEGERFLQEAEELLVTVSVGVAAAGSDAQASAVIDRADRALMSAKEKGRNQVVAKSER